MVGALFDVGAPTFRYYTLPHLAPLLQLPWTAELPLVEAELAGPAVVHQARRTVVAGHVSADFYFVWRINFGVRQFFTAA